MSSVVFQFSIVHIPATGGNGLAAIVTVYDDATSNLTVFFNQTTPCSTPSYKMSYTIADYVGQVIWESAAETRWGKSADLGRVPVHTTYSIYSETICDDAVVSKHYLDVEIAQKGECFR